MTRFILPLLLLIVAIGGFFKFTQPVLGEIEALKIEKSKLNEALNNAADLKAKQEELLAVYREVSNQDIDRLNKLLPDNVDNVRLIIDVNDIARRSGMTLDSINLKAANAEKGEASALGEAEALARGSLGLGFKVSGTYESFKTFMMDLSRSLRLIDVSATSFSSGDEDIYNYDVEIQTYWLK